MTRLVMALCLLVSSSHTAIAQLPSAVTSSPGTAFIDATIVTMTDAGVLEHHTVLVRGDSILAVGPSPSLSIPPGFERVDARGRFLLPGLIDMHVHLSGPADLIGNLRHGVTTVLQMSGQRGAIRDFLSLRDEIERGEVVGPRLFLTGPMFDRIGARWQTTQYAIPHADSVPSFLRRHVEAGYDFFKVHNFTPPEVYRALINSSTVPVIGHIPIRTSVEEALSSGQVMVAHAMIFYYKQFYAPACGDGFWQCMARVRPDLSVLDELVERIARSGIAVTANLSVLAVEQSNDDDWQAVLDDPEFAFLDPSLQARWRVDNPAMRELRAERRRDIDNQFPFNRELVKRLHARGVPILAGTDAGVEGLFPGRALHLELRELVKAGLSPMEALETATSTPGAFLHAHVPRSRRIGRIEPGYAADLVLLDENPTEDITRSRQVRGTLSRGVWWTRDALDRMEREQR